MRRHEMDGVSLGFGILFLVVTALWSVGEVIDNDITDGWILPAVLAVAGAVGIASAFSRRRDRHDDEDAQLDQPRP